MIQCITRKVQFCYVCFKYICMFIDRKFELLDQFYIFHNLNQFMLLDLIAKLKVVTNYMIFYNNQILYINSLSLSISQSWAQAKIGHALAWARARLGTDWARARAGWARERGTTRAGAGTAQTGHEHERTQHRLGTGGLGTIGLCSNVTGTH
jgi:hypothetical protein